MHLPVITNLRKSERDPRTGEPDEQIKTRLLGRNHLTRARNSSVAEAIIETHRGIAKKRRSRVGGPRLGVFPEFR